MTASAHGPVPARGEGAVERDYAEGADAVDAGNAAVGRLAEGRRGGYWSHGCEIWLARACFREGLRPLA